MTASPRQMEPVRVALERAGYPTIAPLLSGHGTKLNDLSGLRWEDWYADVVQAALRITEEGELLEGHSPPKPWEDWRGYAPALADGRTKIFYVGMSFGALLGLRLAIEKPGWLAGLVCIGTPLTMFGWMNAVYPLINYTPLRWFIPAWPKKFEFAVADPEGREVYRQSSYDKFPLTAVREVRRLQCVVRRDLHLITTPLLLIHARKDMTAPPAAVEIIRRSVKSSRAEQMWCERSYHVATLDYDREEIARRVCEFARTIAKSNLVAKL